LSSDEVDSQNLQKEVTSTNKTSVPISLWVFAVLGGAVFVPELIGSDWSPFRMTDDLNMSAGVGGLAYVAFTVGMVIGRLSGDWVVTLINKSQQLKYAVITAFLGLSMVCLVDLVPLVFIGLVISGVGISVLFPTLYDIAAQDSKNAASALGAVTAGSRVFSLVIPVSIGFLADTSWLSVGVVMAVFALSSLLVVACLAGKIHQRQ
jgi:fucose permease